MKTQRKNREQVRYQTPDIEVMEIVTEGVLCGSQNEDNYYSNQEIPEMLEDNLNW